jgi:hypothetical protein
MQTKHGLGDVLILCCAFINLVIFQTAFAKNDLSTLEGFVAAFRQANTGKDTAQLEQLVFWNEAKQSWKTALQQRLKEGLGRKIDKIQILPFSGESRAFGSYLAHPTPLPTHVFVVWYVLPRDNVGLPIASTWYPIGKNNGRFYIIVSERTPGSSMHY